MFEKRDDLLKFPSVAGTGKISTAADQPGMTQPALSRIVARLERQFGGRLFERLPTGVRLTAFGTTAVDLARHVRREIEAAEGKMDAALSSGTGCFRVTAGPTSMQAVLPLAVPRFHESHPGIELKLMTADLRRGLLLLADGRTDLQPIERSGPAAPGTPPRSPCRVARSPRYPSGRPTLSKYSRVTRNTIGASSSRPMRLGTAISPFSVSARFHTRSTLTLAKASAASTHRAR